MSELINLVGEKFERLTVIGRAKDHVQPNGKRKIQWLCKCDCGNEIVVRGDNLRGNTTKSCGCIQKKYNTYDLSGKYGIGYTSKGEEFYFDLEDYEKIKDYCWYIRSDGYISSGGGKNIKLLHRLITNCPQNMVVDHINHNKKDNRKCNLRNCMQQQNTMNNNISKNNTSGVTGVRWDKYRNKWCAQINYNKNIFLGRFNTFEEAVEARKNAELKYFGDYSSNIVKESVQYERIH